MENEIRISVTELLDIVAYSIGKDVTSKLKKHYSTYHDFNRIKDIIIQTMIQDDREAKRQITLYIQRIKQLKEETQPDSFVNPPLKNH